MTESGRRALLIAADMGRRTPDIAPFIARLEAGGIGLLHREAPPLAKLPDMIASLRKEVDCVILAGGPGMMSAAAIALRDSGLALGILPLGADHEVAARLRIPTDQDAAASLIVAGHTRTLDLGSVNGRPFFTVAVMGMEIGTARALGRAQAKGGLAFRAAALRIGLNMRPFSCIIRCGAVIHRARTLQVTVGNGLAYRGAMPQAVDTGDNRHLLEMYSLEPMGRWGLTRLGHVFESGDPELFDPETPEFRTATSPVMEVVTRLPHTVIADGEAVTVTPARFSVLPQAVTVYAPAPETGTAESP